MAESFKNTIIAFVLVGLFAFALISFAVQFQTDNNTNSSLLNNEALNSTFGDIKTNLGDVKNDSQKQREGFEEDKLSSGFGELVMFTILNSVRKFMSMVIQVPNLIFGLISDTLGFDKGGGMSTVIGVIMGIIIISLVLLAWRTVKAGS